MAKWKFLISMSVAATILSGCIKPSSYNQIGPSPVATDVKAKAPADAGMVKLSSQKPKLALGVDPCGPRAVAQKATVKKHVGKKAIAVRKSKVKSVHHKIVKNGKLTKKKQLAAKVKRNSGKKTTANKHVKRHRVS